MQIKTTMKDHATPTKTAKFRTLTVANATEDLEEPQLPCIAFGMQNGTTTLEDRLFLAKLNILFF